MEYIFGEITLRLCKDDDVGNICKIYIEIFPELVKKWKNPQISGALADLTASGRVYSKSQDVEKRFITLRHIKHQIVYLKDILPFV